MAVEASNIDTSAARSFRASRAHHPLLDRVVTTLTDKPTHSLREAGRSLAEGGVGVWAFFTDGLIVNGTDRPAVDRLLRAKQTPEALIASGGRSLVSVLPDSEHRGGLIDITAHANPVVQAALLGPDHDLLTTDGSPLFYRVFAGDAAYLQPPLVQPDQATERPTMVLLWHANKHLQSLEAYLRRSAPGRDVLLTGSSANITGEKQPADLRDLDPRVREAVDFSINARDHVVFQIPRANRGAIPIIDLTTEIPTIRRPGMYPAAPVHQGLRELLQGGS